MPRALSSKAGTKPKTRAQIDKAAPADKEAAKQLFSTAKHQASFPKARDMRHGFQTIVNDLFADGYDPAAEFKAVMASLQVKVALTPGALKEAANGTEALAERAFRLYIVAKVETEAYIRDTESSYGAIRTAATTHLEDMKAAGVRTKQITDADVKATAAEKYPDEWADICTRRDKAQGMLEHVNNLAGLAKSRCYTVSNMQGPGGRA